MHTHADHLHALTREISGSKRRRLAIAALSKDDAIALREQLNRAMTDATNKQLGTQIAMTLLREQWCVSGEEEEVTYAMEWLVEFGLMTLDSIEYDEEAKKTFAYLNSVQP